MNPSRTPFRAESIGWMGVEDEGRGSVDCLTFKARNGADAKNVLFTLLKKSLFLGCHGFRSLSRNLRVKPNDSRMILGIISLVSLNYC